MRSKFVTVFLCLTVVGLTACGSLENEYSKQVEQIESEQEKIMEQIESEQSEILNSITDNSSGNVAEKSQAETSEEESEVKTESEASRSDFKNAIEYDPLQQLYLDIDSEMNYSEMIELVKSCGLPYSEEKYNGRRKIQVAFLNEITDQKYTDSNGDYIEIIYLYPENENSSNDVLEKYFFGTCVYVPCDCSMKLISHVSGSYFSYREPGNYISDLGTDLQLDKDITKEQQFEYYFKNR